jgi:hypothetical protein
LRVAFAAVPFNLALCFVATTVEIALIGTAAGLIWE